MKKELSPQALIGVIAAAVIVLGIIGWFVLKPQDDGVAKPHMQQLGATRTNRLGAMDSAGTRSAGGQ